MALDYTIGGNEIPVTITDSRTGEKVRFEIRELSDTEANQFMRRQLARVPKNKQPGVAVIPNNVDFVEHDILTLALYNIDKQAVATVEDLAGIPSWIQYDIAKHAIKLNKLDRESRSKSGPSEND